MNFLKLTCGAGNDRLDVRHFGVTEALSELFVVDVTARSANAQLNLATFVGQPAALQLVGADGSGRVWSGVCTQMTQQRVETAGLSSYSLRIMPSLWLLTQRIDQRIFQQLSIPDIVGAILKQWRIAHRWRIERTRYPKLDLKIQYGESDYLFLARLLEEAGIAFCFEEDDEAGSILILADALHTGTPGKMPAVPFVDHPNDTTAQEYVTNVRLAHEVRPGSATLVDYDFRRPSFRLQGSAAQVSTAQVSTAQVSTAQVSTPQRNTAQRGKAEHEQTQHSQLADSDRTDSSPLQNSEREQAYEQYRYQPGAMLANTAAPGDTPVADDRGAARYSLSRGEQRAERTRLAQRGGRESISFSTNLVGLSPATVFSMDHPHPELSPKAWLLVTRFQLSGEHNGRWSLNGDAVFVSRPYLPPLKTPIPRIRSVQSATVVGPANEEIHTDEFGRVRVHFPWDRQSEVDERSCCWVRVNQGWSGAKYGMINLPRIGQEVLVSFIDGHPDQPVVVSRIFNAANPVPYKLPENKTISTQKGNSSIGSEGFNELKYEDKLGHELYFLQAEKNLRKQVVEDETITVLRDRYKLVKNDERDTIEHNRTEVTKKDRVESTEGNRIIALHGEHRQQVGGDENERTDGSFATFRRIDDDLVVRNNRRDLIRQDHHRISLRDRCASTEGDHSAITIGQRHHRVMGSQAVEVAGSWSIRAGSQFVAEGIEDVTFKTAGGFIRINSGGMTIRGDSVDINSGGAPEAGRASTPDDAEVASERAFQVAPERVAALVSVAEKHGVPLPDTLGLLSLAGVKEIALTEHGIKTGAEAALAAASRWPSIPNPNATAEPAAEGNPDTPRGGTS